MYPEFIAIYIGLGVLALLQIISIVVVIIMCRKNKKQPPDYNRSMNQTPYNAQRSEATGVAFCVNCGAQFNAAHKVCPKCGTPRR